MKENIDTFEDVPAMSEETSHWSAGGATESKCQVHFNSMKMMSLFYERIMPI